MMEKIQEDFNEIISTYLASSQPKPEALQSREELGMGPTSCTCNETTTGGSISGTYIGGSYHTSSYNVPSSSVSYANGDYFWWPTYWPNTYDDRLARAFRVVQKLMEKKFMKLVTIQQFIEMVNEVTEAL